MNQDVFEVPARTEYRYLVQEEDEEEVQYVRHRHYISPFLVLSRRCIFFIGLGVLALLALATYLAYVAQTLPPSAAQVSTDCGEFRGRHNNGAYSFKGMAYAAPPVGELRWAPPAAPTCRSRVTDAGRFRSMCPQVRPMSRTGKVMGQEDCLYVNVWTPSLQPDAKLPVMVWIHGGHLHTLSGGEPCYSPTETLAANTGLVYVSFNYRLNAFGFLALEMLREGSPTNTSGNYGLMDQIAALKWVQRNIHAFGGDPGKVTIFGQSSVWTLMTSQLAKGLFQAAVDMSGPYVRDVSLKQAESDNLVFLKRTKCEDLSCVRRLSVPQVLQAIPWQEHPLWAPDGMTDLPTRGHFIGPVAVVDGFVLEAPTLEVWGTKGGPSDVPLVVGTTEQEMDFRPPAENISRWTWEDYRWFVTDKLEPFSKTLPKDALDLYPVSGTCPTVDRCPEWAYTTMASDIRVTCPNNELAGLAAAALTSPVYRYVVTHTPSGPISATSDLLPFSSRFAFHRLDALAFFRGLESVLGTPPSDGDKRFQEVITRHLVTFAKTGKMEKAWPEFPAATALLSGRLSVTRNHSAARCDLWRENDLFAYAWPN
ncbi:para-nitrobenzyl esterase [Pleuronectes platessa]|uniref:para-nitrobenzyl esterase n=1 Tax=Pleuronectes platessa TaxID=8262 RepID=UPI00232A4482|nr:para-nitrobenzyl esterase [Pleuronectes platessa]XP_053283991.1 para-nitrobenzyl esterase [Pleuronectes platessa]XP_053283992.1 para-nitrobenzyl esterase [Pleuronectes platessa]XP_053283994.1 para-nitrobenzyl esterase [Pleuronectes platessa]XP_053283997.1 para-nitrobenzyl esterase [Pleuronectes platessa]XP_053284005.1 para-nitrobenzyl esterase [Pleuronectes platessa]